jgi:hypothetical protein
LINRDGDLVRFRDAEKETNDLLQACNELAKEIAKLA